MKNRKRARNEWHCEEQKTCQELFLTPLFLAEFVSLLEHGKAWRSTKLACGAIDFGTRRIAIDLLLMGGERKIVFELHGDRLVASERYSNVFARLSLAQRDAWQTALTGLYKVAGVHCVIDGSPHAVCDRGRQFSELALTWEHWIQACNSIEQGKMVGPLLEPSEPSPNAKR